MKITVFNLKGGQGKTTVSLALALSYGFLVVTNDEYSPIDKILPKGHAKILRHGEALPVVPDDANIIYDFGGYPDERILSAMKKSNWIIVPVIYDSPLDVQVTIKSVREIEKHNKNILLVANKAQQKDLDSLKKIFDDFFSYPLFRIKKSTAFVKMIKNKKSLQELTQNNSLLLYNYKEAIEQLEAIREFINQQGI